MPAYSNEPNVLSASSILLKVVSYIVDGITILLAIALP